MRQFPYFVITGSLANTYLNHWKRMFDICTVLLGNPGEGERDSGMIPNSIPG